MAVVISAKVYPKRCKGLINLYWKLHALLYKAISRFNFVVNLSLSRLLRICVRCGLETFRLPTDIKKARRPGANESGGFFVNREASCLFRFVGFKFRILVLPTFQFRKLDAEDSRRKKKQQKKILNDWIFRHVASFFDHAAKLRETFRNDFDALSLRSGRAIARKSIHR